MPFPLEGKGSCPMDKSSRQRFPCETIRLRDGRTLAYATYGDVTGKPVFHFHGHPGSRLEGSLADSAARRLAVRLIAVDRPGMGSSDFDPQRTLLDWPDRVIELADALGLATFAVQGVSGGGPYALACAFKIPERLTACGIIAGLGPIHQLGIQGMNGLNQLQFTIARRAPWLLRLLFWSVLGRHGRAIHNQVVLDQLVARISKGVRRLTGSQDLAKAYAIETLEAFCQGTKGVAFDAHLYVKPWGFRLEDIQFPNIFLWHGDQDVNVPISMAHAVSDAIPGCHTRFLRGKDHLTVILMHLEEALATMSNPSTRPVAPI